MIKVFISSEVLSILQFIYLLFKLTLSTLGKIFSRHFEIFLFFPENRKNKKNIINLSSAENVQRVVKVKISECTIKAYMFEYRIVISVSRDWLCLGLTTGQSLWVILCSLPVKGRREIVEEMRERDRGERGKWMKIKTQHYSLPYTSLQQVRFTTWKCV